MSEHYHDHEESSVSKKLLGQATIINGLIGLTELVVGIAGGSNIIQADAVHNAVDTSMYGLKWRLTGQEDRVRVRNYRKWIMGAICLGSAIVGAKAGYELITEQYEQPSALVVGVAAGAGVANVVVAGRLHATRHGAEGIHHDGLRHAASDALGSVITVSCATLAYNGFEAADPIGALITVGATICMNFPTQNRLDFSANSAE